MTPGMPLIYFSAHNVIIFPPFESIASTGFAPQFFTVVDRGLQLFRYSRHATFHVFIFTKSCVIQRIEPIRDSLVFPSECV